MAGAERQGSKAGWNNPGMELTPAEEQVWAIACTFVVDRNNFLGILEKRVAQKTVLDFFKKNNLTLPLCHHSYPWNSSGGVIFGGHGEAMKKQVPGVATPKTD